MQCGKAVLESARKFLREEVAPHAQEIDGDRAALAETLNGLCERDMMALRRPERFGGPDVDDLTFFTFQQELARTSGALAFLTTQHQSAVGMLARSDNEALAEAYLPQMGDGRKLVGIGFSQLRRAGPPVLCAEPVSGGYSLSGQVPWATGAGFFPEILVGATLPNGDAVFGIAPLSDQPDNRIRLSEPMRLAAMESANTVSAHFSGLFLADEMVLFVRPTAWLRGNEMINLTVQSHFALGCAQAGVDIVRAAASRKSVEFLSDAADRLDAEVAQCRSVAAGHIGNSPQAPEISPLECRAWAIELAVRCAHAGVAASSGAALSLTHPAQRIYREAMVYTISAQTTPIMEATMGRLVR